MIEFSSSRKTLSFAEGAPAAEAGTAPTPTTKVNARQHAMMRETKEAYLVGVATNEEGRTLDLPMDFLEKGTEYEAVVVEDGDDAHYLHNREQLKVRRQQVSADSVVQVKLAPGGGCCLLIRKKI